MNLYVRIIFETLLQLSVILSVKLRSISGTSEVDSVVIFDILEHPKVVKARLS